MRMPLLIYFPAPGDYSPLANVPLSFSISAAISSTSCADISINDDLIVEYVEEFSVSLSSSDPVIIDPIQEANVTIDDNDCEYHNKQTYTVEPPIKDSLY